MTKPLIIGLVAAVIVAGGIATYVISQNDSDSSSSSEISESNKNSEVNNSKATNDTELVSTFNKLKEDGKDVKCTYSFVDDNSNVAGTAYFSSDQKARLDYSSIETGEDGKTVNASMIISDESQIFWDNDSKKGFEVSLSADQVTEAQTGVDTNKDINFKCEYWNADLSYYDVPSDVNIQDLNSLMDQLSPTN